MPVNYTNCRIGWRSVDRKRRGSSYNIQQCPVPGTRRCCYADTFPASDGLDWSTVNSSGYRQCHRQDDEREYSNWRYRVQCALELNRCASQSSFRSIYTQLSVGINGFGKTAELANITVTGSGGVGGDQYIISPLTTTLQNPSNVSLATNDIALPVIYMGTQIGRAAISVCLCAFFLTLLF